jgi:hypothetical protein
MSVSIVTESIPRLQCCWKVTVLQLGVALRASLIILAGSLLIYRWSNGE